MYVCSYVHVKTTFILKRRSEKVSIWGKISGLSGLVVFLFLPPFSSHSIHSTPGDNLPNPIHNIKIKHP